MLKIMIETSDGGFMERAAVAGETLMAALRDAGEVEGTCGGCCSCATCHVHISSQWMTRIGAVSEDELTLLEDLDGYEPERSRLSCQILMEEKLDGIEIAIPSE